MTIFGVTKDYPLHAADHQHKTDQGNGALAIDFSTHQFHC